MRGGYVGNTFLDASASAFLLSELKRLRIENEVAPYSGLAAMKPDCANSRAAGLSSAGPTVAATPPPFLSAWGCSVGQEWIRVLCRPQSLPHDPVDGCKSPPPAADVLRIEFETEVVAVRGGSAISDTDGGGECAAGGGSCRASEWIYCGGHGSTTRSSGGCLPQQSRNEAQMVAGEELGAGMLPRSEVAGCGAGTGALEKETDWPLWVRLTNDKLIGCDFLVSATGVTPAVSFMPASFLRGPDGGLLVDARMRVRRLEQQRQRTCEVSPGGVCSVYAAGDAACVQWPRSSNWFQMRLWSQVLPLCALASQSGRCAVLFAVVIVI